MARALIPNMHRFDFKAFIERTLAKDEDFAQLFHAFDQECARTEAAMRGKGGKQARVDGALDHLARLKRVMFWFHHGVLADQGQERETCRRLAEKLVARGNLKPEALNVFDR